MAISPEDILMFAEDCSRKSGEVNHRNAVARSYYASFHCVKQCLVNEPDSQTSSVHAHLIRYLEKDAVRNEPALAGTKEGMALSYMLKALKTRRVIAEYELDDNFDEAQASLAVADAKKLFARCNELFK
ncbi:hypothetical protein [Aeromonas caviae]|uniref:hypothetical protein n=1 Tax=Aeromonas caviae TaxID=648 RepID=UPI001CC5C286|nr:hypothetical protein [Aeromonas caviae]GJA84694.1 hypothetical protein KAM356_07530 [Aeromonas caviae]GJA88728.1 hypothetical protein KAM357_06760 [Aeromonas caviae]GJB06040.1 hypothetical protein KAM361_07130 [Aeromonas caviae]GJB14470.1 hypothetical protein KAM363_04750 [Aeromonas caviae]GJB35973.1 hypothetical protein KAM368_05400 [Aeromonas caviae]